MQKTFEFDVEYWIQNRAIRSCSPAARGFWVDLLCLMHQEAGYLTLNGKPIDDTQLSRLVGEPVKSIRGWIKELGDVGVFAVTADGRMYAPSLIDQKKKVPPPPEEPVNTPPVEEQPQELGEDRLIPPPEPGPAPALPPSTPRKALPWWKSPAGWAKFGRQQALEMRGDETFEEFQCRVAARVAPGPHLEVLSEYQQRMVEALRPKDPNSKEKS